MPLLPLRHALALGLLHGPTELLPISSSAHTTLVPWLAGWPYGELPPEMRKSFEVALHAGTAAALLVHPPGVRLRGRTSLIVPSAAPPALAGYTLGGQIERHLGTPATIAAGLIAGSLGLIAAGRRTPTRVRPAGDAGFLDGLMLGLGQALALMPGVSRSGAALVVARTRGFSPMDADELSWRTGLPVIAGAALLKGTRLARNGAPRGLRLALVTGAASAFLSTLVSTRLLNPERRVKLLPVCVAYRGALSVLTIRRMRENRVTIPANPKKIEDSHSPTPIEVILGRARRKS